MKTNLKPFDLQEALKGKPVMLRNGSKAYVRHYEAEISIVTGEVLLGYIEDIGAWYWCLEGNYNPNGFESQHDIIGMYSRSRIINGFEVPMPEKDAPVRGVIYYTADASDKEFCLDFLWDDDSFDNRVLKRGLVFLNKEDAAANAKAMVGIDPYQEEAADEAPFKDKYTLEQVIGDIQLSGWVRWVAVDEDGEVYGYSDRPYLSPCAGTWDISDDSSLVYLEYIDPPADFTKCIWEVKK